MKFNILIVITVLFFSQGCGSGKFYKSTDTKLVDHEQFSQLLKKNVTSDGLVNYKGFIEDSLLLNKYLNELSTNPPSTKWSDEEQLAYWINAYNGFTIQLIIRNYPLESIKDIKKGITFVNSVWDIKFFEIGGEKLDLNKIEHGIIRKRFDEPRIHFAVNCASYSCPALRNEAFTSEKLDKQLDEQATSFINDEKRNKITPDNPQISSIFNWFTGDFTKELTLVEFINQYSEVKINEGVKPSYLDYDWSLNE